MIRKSIGTLGLIGFATFALAQSSGSGLLTNFGAAINAAKTLSASYTVQVLGSAASAYKIDLQKPNLARIETPESLIVADGSQITTFDKQDQSFYKTAQTEADLKALFTDEEYRLWSGFFVADAYKAVQSKNLGLKNRKGQSLTAVEAWADKAGKKTITYFLKAQDGIARQAQIDLEPSDPARRVTTILDAKNVVVNTPLDASLFTFTAPEGSREISYESVIAGKWLTNLEEAKKLAAKTGRKIFVDFMATWCGPCKMLERDVLQTERFKSIAGKKLVLLRIDVDAQPSVASAYSVDAMPTQMVLDQNGKVLATTVGYGGPEPFYAFLLPAVGR